IDDSIDLYRDTEADFVATDLVMHLPRGTDVEVLSPAALRWADEHATGVDRVHVTSSIYGNPYLFQLEPLRRPMEAGDLRVTVDTPADYEAVQAIVGELGDRPPSVEELVELLARRPDIVAINSGVQQKAIDEG
ncbi:MAG: spore coat protein, partial [Acidimicrobiia bacterium]|nr:spore coat protein [Acidimicrobiia bacterium]